MYILPDLPYDYNALEPYIDESTMRIHHDKHHAAYVKGANLALEKLAQIKKTEDTDLIKSWLQSLSFNASGHILHSIFWKIMISPDQYKEPKGKILEAINEAFNSQENLWNQLQAASFQVEGSGWGMLVFEPMDQKLLIAQTEKHNLLVLQAAVPLLVIDVWEHAYYLKYQNERAAYLDNFKNIINWEEVGKNYEKAISNLNHSSS